MMRGSVIVHHSFCKYTFVTIPSQRTLQRTGVEWDTELHRMRYIKHRKTVLVPLKAAVRNSFVSTFHCVRLLHKENYTHLAGGFASSYSFMKEIVSQHHSPRLLCS